MTRVTEPREIASGVLLMTSGAGPMAANLYLVRSGTTWAMVDCGWAGSAEPVRRAVEQELGNGWAEKSSVIAKAYERPLLTQRNDVAR